MILYREKLNEFIDTLIEEYNIQVQIVKPSKFDAAAAVLQYGDKHFIFINYDLPDNLFILCLFHEIAHIRSKRLHRDTTKYDISLERRMNLIAVQFLKTFIKLHYYFILTILAIFSERHLYRYFSKKNNFLPEVFYKWRSMH